MAKPEALIYIMQEEGYIKFTCHWTETAPVDPQLIVELNPWRDRLYAAKLLGAYPDGIGYGNISQRLDEERFVISGSATGNLPNWTNGITVWWIKFR